MTMTFRKGDRVFGDVLATSDTVLEQGCPSCGCPASEHATDLGDGPGVACQICSAPGSACIAEHEAPEFYEAVEDAEIARRSAHLALRAGLLDDLDACDEYCSGCGVDHDAAECLNADESIAASIDEFIERWGADR